MDNQSVVDLVLGIIQAEGGYVNDPYDPGGPTNMGITLRTFREFRDQEVSIQQLKDITVEEVIDIYVKMYFLVPKFDRINDPYLQYLLTDCAVLHGIRTSIRWLQKSVKSSQDGVIGPNTLNLVNHKDPKKIMRDVTKSRLKKIGRIISHNKDMSKYASGWINRAVGFL